MFLDKIARRRTRSHIRAVDPPEGRFAKIDGIALQTYLNGIFSSGSLGSFDILSERDEPDRGKFCVVFTFKMPASRKELTEAFETGLTDAWYKQPELFQSLPFEPMPLKKSPE